MEQVTGTIEELLSEVGTHKDDIEIRLTKDHFALISKGDLSKVAKCRWHFDGQYAAGYRPFKLKGEKKLKIKVRMHRLLISCPPGMEIDHVNGNKLDNRRENLRVVFRKQNVVNQGIREDNASGFKGVYYVKTGKRIKRWCAYVGTGKDRKYSSYFLTPEEAAIWYNHEKIWQFCKTKCLWKMTLNNK